ncbi:glycosyltransferase [Actinomadura xylanilytica]|uniref:glycosyltransferase n=1 Tax=Actinomadura xylanilytica TaxID=887459 RepID=UPI00255AC0CF|nr:glycosyltransferase [Actinomadura xylanilytica]MDL4773211.1 glycosyltransferase [Actinomadura xylanilytica]
MTGLKVLHVCQPTLGGVARYVEQAAADQRDRGWDVAVACPPGGGLAGRLDGLGVRHFAWEADRSPGRSVLPEAYRLRRVVRSFGPQVVHLHSAKAGLAGRLLGPPRRTRVIFQPHGWSWLAATGWQASMSVLWERAAAARADLLICVGAGELELGRSAGVPARFRVVRNGVDRTAFTPAGEPARRAARDALNVPADAPVAVCVGRVTRQKGQDVLVAAWPRVRRRCPDALLVIVGDGEDAARLRERSGPGVRFVPEVANPRRWLAASNVVVLPSRWEGLPLTALEALATGRSLVASAIPGLGEVVGPDTGALVPVEDPAALAGAISDRLLFPELAEAEGRAGAAEAACFDAGDTFGLLAGLTSGLTSGPAVPRTGRRAGRRSLAESAHRRADDHW